MIIEILTHSLEDEELEALFVPVSATGDLSLESKS